MLKSRLIVDAILRAAQTRGFMAVVARKGDVDGGAVYVRAYRRDGTLELLTPTLVDLDGGRAWRSPKPDFTDQQTVDAYMEKVSRNDPDLWLLDVETDQLAELLPDLA